MTTKRRVDVVFQDLTAKERGLLVLRAWKEGKDEDPSWRSTMPAWQVLDFNRLVRLMNAANQSLALYVYALSQEVEKLSLRLAMATDWGPSGSAWGGREGVRWRRPGALPSTAIARSHEIRASGHLRACDPHPPTRRS